MNATFQYFGIGNATFYNCEIMRISIKERKQLLVLADTNSWSPAFWGGKRSNIRGQAWERYLENGLSNLYFIYAKNKYLIL